MSKKQGSTKAVVDQRLEEVEELLDAGVPTSSVARSIAKKYGVTPRQARNYIEKVARRAAVAMEAEGPFIRPLLVRKVQRAAAKCAADKKHVAWIGALGLEAKLSGAYRHTNRTVVQRLKKLGAPPKDSKRLVAWTQELLAIALYDAMTNPSIEPIRRFQIAADIGAKIGLLQDKAELERELKRLAEKAGVIDAELVEAGPLDADEEQAGVSSGD